MQKAFKGQAIADYLPNQPLNDLEFSESLFLDKDGLVIEPEPSNVEPWRWNLYFNRGVNSIGNGLGVVLVSPKGQ